MSTWPKARRLADARGTDGEYDVVVVGFGGAGAAAAIEAADAGARVLALDRFGGGGATARSGGVVYAGGGTRTQREAGVEDSLEAMVAYLRTETDGVIDDETLRAFCEGSRERVEWLEALGVTFPPRLCLEKTAYPPDEVGLYFSGNERSRGGAAPAAPRGHVPAGVGQRGHVIFEALRRAALARGVEVRDRHRVTSLVTDAAGRVTGVEGIALPGSAPLRRLHAGLHDLAVLAPDAAVAIDRLERRTGRPFRAEARGGVVLAAGGFAFDREMVRAHAPAYAGCVPLGTPGDDGSGVRLGLSVGGEAREMGSCAACRFLYPPVAFQTGLLVDERGERIGDESLYGATVSRAIAARGGARAWLVLDAGAVVEARRQAEAEERLRDRPLGQILSGEMNALVYRKATTLLNLTANARRASTLAGLERRCGIPRGGLEATVSAWNEGVRYGSPDPEGKPAAAVAPLDRPPFLAVRCDLGAPLFPSPTFTLGGLLVDGASSAVLRPDGSPVAGLYAAGRTAASVPSRSYVSGLSIADCLFTGRNAGRAAAAAAQR